MAAMSGLSRSWIDGLRRISALVLTERLTLSKVRSKAGLPRKSCKVCGRPFAWRKKWARDWDNVLYCSDRCRSGKGTASAAP